MDLGLHDPGQLALMLERRLQLCAVIGLGLALNKVDLVEKEKLLVLAQAANEKARFDATFMISAIKGDGVADVRGAGCLIAAELAPGIDAKAVAQACLDRGLVLNAVTPSALRLAPSLLVTDNEIDDAVAIVAAACNDERAAR